MSSFEVLSSPDNENNEEEEAITTGDHNQESFELVLGKEDPYNNVFCVLYRDYMQAKCPEFSQFQECEEYMGYFENI